MPNRVLDAVRGISAALAGVGAGHLVAALTVPAASPPLVVGSTVIDLTPTPVKEWAIRAFGTADKPVLLGSVLLGLLALAAVAGLLGARRRAVGIAMLLALAALAGVLALLRPGAGPSDLLPSLAAAAAGGGGLWWLLRPGSGRTPSRGLPHEPSRRALLARSGAVALAATASGVAGEVVGVRRSTVASVTLPPATDVPPALASGLDRTVPGISPFRTPNTDFYRVDTRLSLPVIDPATWRLTIDGDVDREVSLGLKDLFGLEVIERDITMTCVSNEVGGPYVGAARWRGVRLRDVLDRAGVGRTAADQILSRDVAGMTISTPLRVALDGRDSMLAFGMNGTALPAAHGFPVRMVVPGLYGFVGACKWITRMTLTTYAEQTAYWTERDWAIDAPIRIASRIDTPRPLSDSPAGTVMVGGVAWAQGVGIAGVEVRVDDGPWRAATLGPDAGDDYWRQWSMPWDARTGQHTLAVRARDKDGRLQDDARRKPFPSGSSGIQSIVVNIS